MPVSCEPLPINTLPVILPVADINPAVSKLPLVVLAVTVSAPSVPTEVILVCAAVANVPVILVPDKLPPVMLPAADINPAVSKLPPVTLPLALTTDPVIDGVLPCNTVVPPAGLVIVTAVALAEICALPK